MKTRRSRIEDGGWRGRAGTLLSASFGRARGPSRAEVQVGLEVPFEPHNGAHGVTRPTFRVCALPLRLGVSAVMLLFGLSVGYTQSYSIDWHKIAGGGGTSTGGVYSVSGTSGQSDAGPTMSNGQYSVAGGFWALPQTVQTEGAPTLTIIPDTPNHAKISWTPDTGTNWVLQEALSLSPANWVNSASGSTNPIVVPATLPTKFYRLRKP